MESDTEINICDLPLTVLVDIFKLLSTEDLVYSVRLTCKLWYQLSHEGSLWRQLDVCKQDPWKHFNEQSFLKLLSAVQDSVESVHFDFSNSSTHMEPGVIQHEDIHCTNLKEICVTTPAFGSEEGKPHLLRCYEALFNVSEKYHCLKSLKLCVAFDEGNLLEEYTAEIDLILNILNGQEIQKMTNVFPNLEKLIVRRCDAFFDSKLIDFIVKHPNLTHLEVDFRFMKIDRKFSDTVSVICLSLSELETLVLENYTVYVDTGIRLADVEEISDDEEETRAAEQFELVHLKTLVLTNSDRSVDDAFLKKMVQRSSRLEYLSIGGVDCITNIGLESVSKCCPNLKQLYLCTGIQDKDRTAADNHHAAVSNITDAGIERIVEQCHGLTVLDLTCCSEITDQVIEAIAGYCPKLEKLFVKNCLAISDNAICAIAEKSIMLRQLDVSFCAKLTAKSFSSVIKSCHYLQCLYANSCHRVSDLDICPPRKICEGNLTLDTSDVLTALENHSHITRLEFSFCANLTNASMKQIGAFCKDLRQLNVQACSLVTNAGVKEVMRGCLYLRELNISGGSISQTTRLNDDCLNAIAELGCHLEVLAMYQNAHITAQAVFQVIKCCPKISFVTVDNRKTSGLNQQSLLQCSSEVNGKTISMHFLDNRTKIMVYKDKELENKFCLF